MEHVIKLTAKEVSAAVAQYIERNHTGKLMDGQYDAAYMWHFLTEEGSHMDDSHHLVTVTVAQKKE